MKNFVDFKTAVSEYNDAFKYVLDIIVKNNHKYEIINEDSQVVIKRETLEGFGSCLTITAKLTEDLVTKVYFKDSISNIECFLRIGTIDDVDDSRSYRKYLSNKGINFSLPEDIKIGDFDRGLTIATINKYDESIEYSDKYKNFMDVILIMLRNPQAA